MSHRFDFVKVLACVALSLAFVAAVAGSPGGDAGITRPILEAVISGRTPLTKEMHEIYWREIQKGPPMSPADLRATMVGAFELNLEFQRNVWLSARESAMAKRVIRTPALIQSEARFMQRMGELMPLSPRSVEYRDAMNEVAAGMRSMRIEADSLLQSAAGGAPFILRSGAAGVVDEKTVQSYLLQLDEVRARIDQLLNPVWVANRRR